MAGGFRSPLVVLGRSGGAAPATQGGYYTLPWFQAGGGITPTEQGGYYTLPWWQAGGGITPSEQGGYYTLPWWQAGGGVGEEPEPEVEQTKGGQTRRKVIRLPVRRELGSDELFPPLLSEASKAAILDRKVDVDGVEVNVPSAPVVPVLELQSNQTPLSLIIDPVEREIADLVRAEAISRFERQVILFKEEALKFDEEFILLLLLMLD